MPGTYQDHAHLAAAPRRQVTLPAGAAAEECALGVRSTAPGGHGGRHHLGALRAALGAAGGRAAPAVVNTRPMMFRRCGPASVSMPRRPCRRCCGAGRRFLWKGRGVTLRRQQMTLLQGGQATHVRALAHRPLLLRSAFRRSREERETELETHGPCAILTRMGDPRQWRANKPPRSHAELARSRRQAPKRRPTQNEGWSILATPLHFPHSHAVLVERGTRLELATACLEGRYSTN